MSHLDEALLEMAAIARAAEEAVRVRMASQQLGEAFEEETER